MIEHCSILATLVLSIFVRRPTVGELDIPPADNLPSPRRLRMLQMVGGVIEFGDVCELDGVQAPNNVRVPFRQLNATLVRTAKDLELLGSRNAMLSVNDHQLPGLDLVPQLWLLFQEPPILVGRREAHLLAHLCISHLYKLSFHALNYLSLQLADDIFILC